MIAIVVAVSGWAFLGNVEDNGGDYITIAPGSRTIIRWGTTGGLEQLAEGPSGNAKPVFSQRLLRRRKIPIAALVQLLESEDWP